MSSLLPFIFGSPGRDQFGSFHARPPATPARCAVLLCSSFGEEGLQLHRTLRLIADRLSRSGIDVLRFDYFGSGDSGGDDNDANLEGWARDVEAAHSELVTRSGVTRVVWVGFRLGAIAAQLAVRSHPPGLARLVLVDPIADGRLFLDDLRTIRNRHEQRWDEPPSTAYRKGAEQHLDEALGFAIPRVFFEQLRALRFEPTAGLESTVIADSAIAGGVELAEKCANKPGVRFVPHPLGERWFSGIVPPQAIKLIVDEASQ